MTLSPDAAFWDRIARKYAARPVSDQEAYEEKLRRSQAVFPPDTRILEFGCGTGSTALRHAPHVAHCLATDAAPSMIEIAREKAAEAGVENVEFAVETLDDRAQDGPVWDAVLGLNILHLLPDPAGGCRTAFDILKPGGVFITSTATLGSRLVALRPLIWVAQMLGKAPKLTYLTEKGLEAMLTDAGFGLEDVWRQKSAPVTFIIARKPG